MKPEAFQKPLLAWYARVARDLPWRRTRDPYAIWVSEIMCQQTRVATVIPYYERFVAALPSIESLAAAETDVLQRLWKGLGYYRRAALLHRGAQYVMEKHGGRLPASLDALAEIPGMGPYTAGAVASIAFEIRAEAVDGNVVRVFSRWLNDALPADALRKKLQDGFANKWVAGRDPGAWNQALMELGATVCTPRNPKCSECPVQGLCAAHKAGTAGQLPTKGMAGKHVEQKVCVFVFRQKGLVWIERRPAVGLLANLWGFPMAENKSGASNEVLRYRHVFTHRTWHISVFEVAGRPNSEAAGRWAKPEELHAEAIPTAFSPVVEFLTKQDLFTVAKSKVNKRTKV